MINRRNFLTTAGAVGTAALLVSTASTAIAQEMMTTATGMFEGRSNHVTSGSVKVIEEGGRTFVELGDDFSLDGGPDPRVIFGKDGEHNKDAYLGALLSLNGKQRYALPSTWSATDYNEVYIWCDVAGVPLGVASLN
ncbi:MAG: DM13 domain-containing protein [Roseovarius sp.]|nr:DM13 domain-containing protein [Roseovarius sp.]